MSQPRKKARHAIASYSNTSWAQPDALLGSAVRHLASMSPKFNWVGIYLLKGKVLELGPFIGAATDHKRIPVGRGICGKAVAENRDIINVPDVTKDSDYLACSLETKSELVVLIRNADGKILGQIDIDSHEAGAFESTDVEAVEKVAKELSSLWPE